MIIKGGRVILFIGIINFKVKFEIKYYVVGVILFWF